MVARFSNYSQNANDAAIEAGQLGRVRIELHPEGLLVANTGQPFSRDGVDSLRLAHLSPKRARRAQLVGHKGLGFRAVLNWARFPFILSGGLALGYSLRVAREKQNWLKTLSSELAAAIDVETRVPGTLVIPLLAFPGCPSDGELAPFLETDAQRVLYGRACQLRREYDTVVGMPFDQVTDAVVEARAQIARLRPEVLLFAPDSKSCSWWLTEKIRSIGDTFRKTNRDIPRLQLGRQAAQLSVNGMCEQNGGRCPRNTCRRALNLRATR